MKDFLSLADLTPSQLRRLIARARQIKAAGNDPRYSELLEGKVLAMLFSKPSLRTRVSFEVGMIQLGGQALYLSPAEVGLGARESVGDVARVLSRYVDGVVARVYDHSDVVELAAAASIPVVNGLSDHNHPCQALADLLTIEEEFGDLSGVRLAFVGDGNNVAHSLLLGGACAGMSVTVVHPAGYGPDVHVVEAAQRRAEETGGTVACTTELSGADGAQVLYTDVWSSMGQEAEAQVRRKAFQPYQLNEDLVARAAPKCIVLHCLPAHRGDEITDAVIDGPHSRVFDQAENRLHAQKAVLGWLMGQLPLAV